MNTSMKVACSEAMRMSHAKAMLHPAPAATPFTAAITGLSDDQKITYEMVEGRDGRQSAGELKAI